MAPQKSLPYLRDIRPSVAVLRLAVFLAFFLSLLPFPVRVIQPCSKNTSDLHNAVCVDHYLTLLSIKNVCSEVKYCRRNSNPGRNRAEYRNFMLCPQVMKASKLCRRGVNGGVTGVGQRGRDLRQQLSFSSHKPEKESFWQTERATSISWLRYFRIRSKQALNTKFQMRLTDFVKRARD